MAFSFIRIQKNRDEDSQDDQRSFASKDPIEPDIGVNGWTLLWAVLGIVLFIYHWGRALVFVAGFTLNGTPYALVEADGRAPKPLADEDIVFIHRGTPDLRAGQVLWVQGERRPRLAKLVLAGPDSVAIASLANRDRIMSEDVHARWIEVSVKQIVIALGGSAPSDTLGWIVPRQSIRGRAVQVILPPHRVRALP